MADPVEQADAKLKAADAAWTAARSRIHPSNSPLRRVNILKSEGADNPNSPNYAAYLNWKSQYDAAVAEERIAAAAYTEAQENYKQVYAKDNNSTPATPPATTTKPETAAPTPPQSETVPAATQNPSPTQATAEASGPQASALAPATINPNSDPNTNIGAEVQTPTPQQPINPNTDPNTNIGTEAQDLVYDPLTEPPITNDGDEFSGIDEQIQRQKDLEDGSLEFAGIDEQIAANENALQEPPQLSPEEVDAYLNNFNNEPDVQESVFDPTGNQGAPKGISTALNNTRSTATKEDSANFQQKPDWRARLSLAPGADYLYKVPKAEVGILEPLQATDGVIFPYTPAISVTYSAGYDSSELIHSNYKIYQYKGSSVDTVSITADFTAQDTTEANYLLAVIHFFRSVTKMFYGQDKNPNNGVPPPLCYLSGFGAYTYDAHPVVVTNFTYSTPTEVDYIRAGSQTNQPGVNISQQKPALNTFVPSTVRKAMNGLSPKVPNFQTQNTMINSEATYIPTKLQLQITCLPIVTRNDISNRFSLKEYATGALLRGSKNSGGGIW
jgi:hypothetical protein